MLNEIYMRDPSDPQHVPGVLNVSNEIEVLIGQIRMILFTKPGELINNLQFGIDLERFVFDFNVSNSSLEKMITEQIYTYTPLAQKYNVTVESSFFYGTTRDVCLINIFIDGTKYLGILMK